ncbi:hypothetical protein [Streptomyces sp. NBC_01445]|uniref:hypothetical protein n=1 Tax=Streptomyces sp. NBC_01445 TaxID=2903869 RepID=UPI002DD8754F|nr:hypothetical protein [Streptomyces sp. NBC_01445]WSE09210.1 hypothetical protein OG574_41115 [Streptomyces sp. NBC_01445]
MPARWQLWSLGGFRPGRRDQPDALVHLVRGFPDEEEPPLPFGLLDRLEFRFSEREREAWTFGMGTRPELEFTGHAERRIREQVHGADVVHVGAGRGVGRVTCGQSHMHPRKSGEGLTRGVFAFTSSSREVMRALGGEGPYLTSMAGSRVRQ